MTIRILYLYYDFMDLYGENGNIRMLEKRLSEEGADVEIAYKTITDELDFSSCDFVYCASGTEAKRNTALSHLKTYKDDIKNAVNKGIPMLFTGNSWQMLGKEIVLYNGEKINGLSVFDFTAKESNERTTGDAIFESPMFSQKFVGFINKCSNVSGVDTPLFNVIMGSGNNTSEKGEGIVFNSFYGTGLIGPVLVRNPHFLKHFLKLLLKDEYKEISCPFEEKGYEITLKELSARMNK